MTWTWARYCTRYLHNSMCKTLDQNITIQGFYSWNSSHTGRQADIKSEYDSLISFSRHHAQAAAYWLTVYSC